MLSSLSGIAMFCGTLYYLLHHSLEEKFNGFYSQSALLLLVVCPLAVILISRGILDLLAAIRTIFGMTFLNSAKEMTTVANELTQMSYAVRTKGIGGLIEFKGRLKNPLFRDGVALILNSFTTEEIRHNLTAKINTEQNGFFQATSLFESLGKLSPGMGLLGTIVGLIQMLSNLSDPTKIGPGMAVCLLATLYGLILGNVVYMPMAEKIQSYSEKRLQLQTMIMEGVILLKEKKAGAYLRDVVNTYSSKKSDENRSDIGSSNESGGESPLPQARAS